MAHDRNETKFEAHTTAPSRDEDVAIARRKLLRMGAYVAPAVLGTLLYRSSANAQTAITPSCGPCTSNPQAPPQCTTGATGGMGAGMGAGVGGGRGVGGPP